MSWGKFDTQDASYDLTHLDSFTMTVTPKGENATNYKVLVAFGCHTFTEKWDAADPAHLKFVGSGEDRRFCTIRHAHSLALPQLVRDARKVFFTRERNYLIAQNPVGAGVPYAVFFNMEPARLKGVDAAMFVVSAYPKANLPPKKNLDPITMATLVAKTVKGEPIKPPPKRK